MSLMQSLEKQAEKTLSNTYTDEKGVIRCRVCNEPRMHFVQAMGREMPVACACVEREEAETERRKRLDEVHKMLGTSPLYDASYNAFTFGGDNSPDSDASKLCRAYVEHWEDMEKESIGLLFSGTLGTGKSYYAAAVVNALRSRGVSAMIVTTSRLINTMRASRDPQSIADALNAFQLVALDNLGAERDTGYAVEQIENFVNDRILAKRPLLVTTNLTGKELNNPPDMRYARIFDRVLVMCPRPVILTGQSRRIDQRKGRAERCRAILGI